MPTTKVIRVLTRYTDDFTKDETYLQNELSLDSDFVLPGELMLNRANNKLYHKNKDNIIVSLNKPSTMLKLPTVTEPTFPVDLTLENVLVVELVDGVTSGISAIANGYNGAEFTLILKQPLSTIGGGGSFDFLSAPFGLTTSQSTALQTTIGTNASDITIYKFIYLDGSLYLEDSASTGGLATVSTSLDGLTDTDVKDLVEGEILAWNGVYDWTNQTIASLAAAGLALSDLSDIPTPTAANVFLKWNGTNWILDTVPAGTGSTTLASLSDTTFGPLAVDEVVAWDGVNDWVNRSVKDIINDQNIALSDLSDIPAPGVTPNQMLEWDGAAWNLIQTPITNIDDLDDVAIVTLVNGDLLVWNGVTWTNEEPSNVVNLAKLGDLGDVTTPTALEDGYIIAWNDGTQNWDLVPAANATDSNLALGLIDDFTIEILNDNGTGVILPAATINDAGLLSSIDKAIIDSIATLPASGIVVTVAGNLTSLNVQSALEELQTDIDTLNSNLHDPVTAADGSLNITGGQILNVKLDGVTGGGNNIITVTANGIYAAPGGTITTNLGLGTNDLTSLEITSSTGSSTTLTPATTLLAGLLSGTDKVKLDGIATGANLYTHPNHSGDVTSVFDGATTISNNVVSNAKLVSVNQNTIKGRVTAGAGNVEDLTPAEVRSIINVEDGATASTDLGLGTHLTGSLEVTSSTGTSAVLPTATLLLAGLMSGADKTKLDGIAVTANDYSHPNHSGDVTSVGDGATLIANNVVSNDKLANIVANQIKGRITVGTGDVEDLSPAQVRAIINVEDGSTADQLASEVPVTPAGNLTSIDVQAGLQELQADIDTLFIDSHVPATNADTSVTVAAGQLVSVRLDGTTGAGNNIVQLTAAGLYVPPDETNLSVSNITTTTLDIVSDTGTDATIPQAVATTSAGLLSGPDKAKLDGIAASANNYSHPNHSGDVASVGDGSTTIQSDVVDNTKLANMTANTVKGRITSTGDPQDLTAAQIRTLLNVEDGAAADQTAADIPFTPPVGMTSTNVQDAIEELFGLIP